MWWLTYLIEFFVLFCVSYLFYFITELKNRKKKEVDVKKQLSEVKLFVKLYHIDLKKISYKKLCKIISLIISFNLALTVVLAIEVFDSIFLKIGTGLFMITLSMYLGYNLLGLYYTKKGMTTDVQSQKNRK